MRMNNLTQILKISLEIIEPLDLETIQHTSAIDLLIKPLDQVDKFHLVLIQTELLVHVPELYHSMDLLVLFKVIDHQVLSKEKDQLVETLPT